MLDLTQDQLWKAILEDFFDDFLHWFYQPYLLQIDLSRPVEFLDQELLRIYPESEERHRVVDKLVKVWLKNGVDSWFLLHVEAQSYPDPDFAERMYIYQYRIRDLYRKNVTALAILADRSPSFRPEAYSYEYMGTSLSFHFRICKVLDLDIQHLEQTENPFGLALAAAWYSIQRSHRSDEQRLNFKIQLVKRLTERNYARERIRRLLEFIKYYAKFDRPEFYDKFETVIQPNRRKMGILELLEDEAKKQGMASGLKEGRQKGLQEGLQQAIEKLIQKDFSNQQIVDLLEVPLALVEGTRAALATRHKE